jgi:hypothetical protein
MHGSVGNLLEIPYALRTWDDGFSAIQTASRYPNHREIKPQIPDGLRPGDDTT